MTSATQTNPIVMLHGYSDTGKSFETWITKFKERNYDVKIIHICKYISLSNEITIDDIAEGLDQALAEKLGEHRNFDAIVHSTGILVIRAWLAKYTSQGFYRLQHLIGLAPATFGSPIAHKGRSFLGAMFKGSREWGPDFLEAGTRILDSLELGSKFIWDLAHKDLLGEKAFYGLGSDTPFVFTFCGTNQLFEFQLLNELITKVTKKIDLPLEGTDGVVRWAGCELRTRKITIDFTKKQHQDKLSISPWKNLGIAPSVRVKDCNHGKIMGNPSPDLVKIVFQALQFTTDQDIHTWHDIALNTLSPEDLDHVRQWQQFIIRAIDDNDEPISDYYIELATQHQKQWQRIEDFGVDVHVYERDKSLRCFHVDITNTKNLQNLKIRIVASSKSDYVRYGGYAPSLDYAAVSDLELDVSDILQRKDIKFFFPFTTTLVEIRLKRQTIDPLVQFMVLGE